MDTGVPVILPVQLDYADLHSIQDLNSSRLPLQQGLKRIALEASK